MFNNTFRKFEKSVGENPKLLWDKIHNVLRSSAHLSRYTLEFLN